MVRTTTRIEYKWIVAYVYCAAFFMDIMDTTIVNVALPTLGREFDAGTSSIEWIVTGYLLSLAVWIPASGWLGDRFGTKKVLLFAIALFTAASALCGRATSLEELIAFRLLQGVGGGMLTPVGTAMLFRAFPPEERARASAALIIPTTTAPALGPVVGGFLVEHVSWRWIFYINLPIGVLSFIIGLLYLREERQPTAGGFDFWGFALSGGGLAGVLYALSKAPETGWLSTGVLISLFGGLLAFAAVAVIELKIPKPMLDLRLLRDRLFRVANTVSTFAYGGFVSMVFVMPLFLQDLRGQGAFSSGLTTFPQALGVMCSSQLVGRIFYPRIGPRRLILFGLLGACGTVLLFQFVGIHTDLWWIRIILFSRGVFMAYVFIPLQAATFATIKPADTGRASSIYSTQRQVAAALGVAVLATVLTTSITHNVKAATAAAGGVLTKAQLAHAQLRGYHTTFLVSSLLAGVAIIPALFVRDADAAMTMRRKVRAPSARAARTRTAGAVTPPLEPQVD